MTASGEMMLRTKAAVCVGPISRRNWRNSRAESLAKMIAWHRRHRTSAAESFVRSIILEDIVPDCGWPKLSWLKPKIRVEQRRIEASLTPAASPADEDAF